MAAPQILFLHVNKVADQKVLKTEIERLLLALRADLPLPHQITVFNHPYKGPAYDDGTIYIKFPFYKESPASGKIVRKTAQASLPIALHELSHQILETYIHHHFFNTAPQMIWAFYTRADDLYAQASLDFIERTKGRTPYQKMSAKKIAAHFLEMTTTALPFNEFLSDVIPTLFADDADTIYKSVSFGDEDPRLHYRRFSHDDQNLDLEKLKGSEYDSSLPAKLWVWREVFQKNKRKPKPIRFGLLIQKIINATLAAFVESTDHFKHSPDLIQDPAKLNQTLIKHLRLEFP
ncbi:MAG: hypothetical protein AB7N80_06665 [Bdellovibrionales bacterium]